MKFKQSDKYKIINNVLIYNDTNEFRFVTLIDLEGFNNGDLFKYNNELFILIGEYLYGVTNSIMLEANISLVDDLKKLELMDFILDKNYCSPKICDSLGNREFSYNISSDMIKNNIFDEETNLNKLLKIAFNNVVANDEFIDNDNYFKLFTDNVYYNYDWFSPVTDIVKNGGIIDVDDSLIKCDTEFDTVNKEYEIKENEFYDRKDKYENVSTFTEILNNIKKNGRVIKQLKSGVSILNSFLYKNVDIKINNIVDVELLSKQSGIYDYSFLIMNFVKAVEIFLTYKLSKFDGEISVHNKDKRKNELVEFSSDVFKKYSMLGDMINYLDDHSNELFNHEFDEYIIKRFLSLIKDWKDKDRNGYFHKHRLENINDALYIIMSSLQIIVGIELYLNNN